VHIVPGSPAERIGLKPGDRVLAINGNPIRDVLDYQFYAAGEKAEIRFSRGGCEMLRSVALDEDRFVTGGIGIEFAQATFDGVRRCTNRCLFCFVDQLPRGLRPGLYVKDDDFRYSFLYGNFVTLTNLTDEDWHRLQVQRISPLRVSVHATDVSLRSRLIGNPRDVDIMDQLKRLVGLGISIHAQVVLCPGLNDGPALDKTVADLATLFPHLQSIGIVPVAIGERAAARTPELRSFTPEESEAVIRQISRYQRKFRRERGATIVHLADEFYLLANHSFPAARNYDGFVQYENGIGMVRSLLDELARLKLKCKGSVSHGVRRRFTVVTGQMIASTMRQVLDEIERLCGFSFELVPVRNRLFGEHVTVSGLLGGAETIDELKKTSLRNTVFLPRSMLDTHGHWTLDGITKQEFENLLGVPVRFVSRVEEMMR